jgi:hypothetical protein
MMFVHRVSKTMRRLLPEGVFRVIRAGGTAFLTPLMFSFHTGHFVSSILGRPTNRWGQPLLWYTYPAVDFLGSKDFSGRRILEWGGGQSTLWWAKRAREVLTVETDSSWAQRLRRDVPGNVTVQSVVSEAEAEVDGFFDVVVIDGFDRLGCAKRSLDLLGEEGAIILDNSEGYWGPEGTYPIIDLMRERGFLRVDFHGFGACGVRPFCTSLFFRPGCFMVSGKEPPAWYVR